MNEGAVKLWGLSPLHVFYFQLSLRFVSPSFTIFLAVLYLILMILLGSKRKSDSYTYNLFCQQNMEYFLSLKKSMLKSHSIFFIRVIQPTSYGFLMFGPTVRLIVSFVVFRFLVLRPFLIMYLDLGLYILDLAVLLIKKKTSGKKKNKLHSTLIQASQNQTMVHSLEKITSNNVQKSYTLSVSL